jgi:hypothetical protein
MANIAYNRIIRKLVIGFGNLFNKINLVRYNPDLTEAERFLVPLVYATKEFYVRRLEDDPNLDKKVQTTLPRMSFEMANLSYDSTRKLNTNFKNFAQTSSGVISQYNPVPYNFDFNLYIYVRNIEDGTQIIEHVLPYFTPDYTIKLNLIPEMGVVKEIPIVLNSTTHEIVYEGTGRDSETRMIIWTLNFTVKGFVFGKTSTTEIIKSSITNIFDNYNVDDTVVLNMVSSDTSIGNYKLGETVYQGHSPKDAYASAKVVLWTNNALHITNINGNFISSEPIVGTISNSNYTFSSYQVQPRKVAKIKIESDPTTANVDESHTYTTEITEFPDITTPY